MCAGRKQWEEPLEVEKQDSLAATWGLLHGNLHHLSAAHALAQSPAEPHRTNTPQGLFLEMQTRGKMTLSFAVFPFCLSPEQWHAQKWGLS